MRPWLVFPVAAVLLLAPVPGFSQECRKVTHYDVALGVTSRPGILVTNVQKGSIAEAAGLETGDVIFMLGRKSVRDVGGATDMLAKIRENALFNVAVLEVKSFRDAGVPLPRVRILRLTSPDDRFGFSSQPVFYIEQVKPGGLGAKAGVTPGEFLDNVNGGGADTFDRPIMLDVTVQDAIASGKLTLQVATLSVTPQGEIRWHPRKISLQSSGPLDGPVPPPTQR